MLLDSVIGKRGSLLGRSSGELKAEEDEDLGWEGDGGGVMKGLICGSS